MLRGSFGYCRVRGSAMYLAVFESSPGSTQFGFVRTATLKNTGSRDIDIELVDGLQNIFPSGVLQSTYQRASCLVDAYKHNEYDPSTGMGIYSLTSQILDRAEAGEILRATTVWCRGLEDRVVFLSSRGLHAFCAGATPEPEVLCTGERGNYFAYSSIKLAPGELRSWYMVADVARDSDVTLYTNDGGTFVWKLLAIPFNDKATPVSFAFANLNRDGDKG